MRCVDWRELVCYDDITRFTGIACLQTDAEMEVLMLISRRRIMLCMAERKLTFSDLAKRSGLSREGLNKALGRGVCAPATVGRIADGLGVSVEEICPAEGGGIGDL